MSVKTMHRTTFKIKRNLSALQGINTTVDHSKNWTKHSLTAILVLIYTYLLILKEWRN